MPEPELEAPIAAFAADSQTGTAPLNVAFANTSTGTIVGYAWSFGDGTVSQDKSPTHEYAEPGNYTASLTVFNEAGSSTVTYRIDVKAADETTAEAQGETLLDLIVGIRRMLRGPSDQKLPYQDIRDVVNDLNRGYSRDLHVTEQSHRTDETQAIISHIDGATHLLTIPGVVDVEPKALLFASKSDIAGNPTNVVWREVTIVPLDYYSERQGRDAALGSFFGGMVVENGVKIKMNLALDMVKDSVWRIRYQAPFLRVLALAAKFPLPSDFIPMIKTEGVLMCLPRVKDDSEEWYKWRKANEPIFAAMIGAWRDRWKDFLDTNTEPNYAPKTPFNSYRSKRVRQPGHTIEPQDS